MKSHNIYAWIMGAILCIQVAVTGLLLYVTEHTQAIHYFSQEGSPFSDNPIPLANILTVFEVINLVMLTIYVYHLRQSKHAINKAFVGLSILVFILGLAMLLYLHKGPLGSCMSIPDACGG